VQTNLSHFGSRGTAGVQSAEQGGKGSPHVVNGARAPASNVTIDGLNDFNPATPVRRAGPRSAGFRI